MRSGMPELPSLPDPVPSTQGSTSPRRVEPKLTPRGPAAPSPSVRFADSPATPVTPIITRTGMATTTTTTTATSTITSTTTTDSPRAFTTTTQARTPTSPRSPKSPKSPVPPLALDSPGSRIRTGSSPARLNHSPDSLLGEPVPQQMPPASPRTLVSRQRSTGLERDYTIVRQMKAPKAPPYPALAAQWIDEANYLRMDREAQIMIVGFAAIRSVYESAERIFGKHWSWSSDMPMRNWAQKGNLHDEDHMFFDGLKAFSESYREGRLASHLAGALNEVKAEYERNENTTAVVKLAKQADHVLLLALGSLRTLTHRTDVSPEELRAVWKAVTAEPPTAFQLGQLRAFFSQSSCIAIQAFVNATIWLVNEVIRHYTSEEVLQLTDMPKTFHFLCANFLGLNFGRLHELFNTLQQDQFKAALAELGLSADSLTAILGTSGKKQRAALKDELDLDKIAKRVKDHEANRTAALQTTMIGASTRLLFMLVQGDRRFLDAYGLSGITADMSASLSGQGKRSGNSSSSPSAHGASTQSPRDRLVERRRSESSPVKRIMTVERGVRIAQGAPLPSPRRAPDSPRVQNSPARPSDDSRAASSPLKPQLDQ